MDGSLERSAYHEAGHAVVAKLFEENLYMDKVTINTNTTGEITQFGSVSIYPKSNTWISVSLVSLAGMVAELIWTEGPEKVVKNKQAIVKDPGRFINTELGGGDFQYFNRDMLNNFDNYAASESEYEGVCLSFLIDFLCDKQIWSTVRRLSIEVQAKPDLTLNKDELEIIFSDNQLETVLKGYKEKLCILFKAKTNEEKEQDKINRMMNSNDAELF